MPSLLTKKQVKEALKKLDGWKTEGNFVSRVFEFEKFEEGIRFVNAVADVAERLEHHPDINIRYTTVTLALQTHSAGGVTRWDIQLARAIDRLRNGPPPGSKVRARPRLETTSTGFPGATSSH